MVGTGSLKENTQHVWNISYVILWFPDAIFLNIHKNANLYCGVPFHNDFRFEELIQYF